MFRKGTLGRKILVGGLAGGLFVGGGAAIVYRRRLQENKSITAEEFNAQQNQSELKAGLDNIFSPPGTPNKPIIKLYRYTTCPFCGIVKAFMDYHKIEHECVEVDPMLKKQLGEIPYKKVPNLQVVVTGHWGPFIADSEIIVNTLAKAVGRGIEKQIEDKDIYEWRAWSRRELVKFLVLNLNSSLYGAWMGYSYIDKYDTIPTFNKYFLKIMGAPVMFLVAKYMTTPTLKKQGLLKDGDNIRDKLIECVDKFYAEGLNNAPATGDAAAAPADEKAVAKKDNKKAAAASGPKPFHGGDKPDIADLDVYGVLQSLRGHHIYDDIYMNTKLRPWMDRMDSVTGKQPYVVVNPDKFATVKGN